jgi:hypothetical protein
MTLLTNVFATVAGAARQVCSNQREAGERSERESRNLRTDSGIEGTAESV